MADVKTVAIRLAADTEQFKKGMSEAGDATNKFSKGMVVGLAVAEAAVVGFAIRSANSYVEYGKSIMGLARISGENIETSSKMNFAAQQSGVSTEKLTTGIRFMEKAMAGGNDAFGKLGVNVQNADGSLRSSHDVLLDVSDALAKMGNGAAKTAAIQQIFGRGGQDMGKLLNQGRAAMIALENEAEKYGLVLKGDNIDAIKANIQAHRQLDAAMQGFRNRIGQDVLPVLTKVTQGLVEMSGPVAAIAPPVMGAVAALGTFVVVGAKLKESYQSLSTAIPKLGPALAGVGGAIGLAIVGYELWNNRMQEAYANANKLADGVAKANASGTYTEMVDRIGKINGAIADLGNEVDNTKAPWDLDYRAEMEAYQTKLIGVRDSMVQQVGAIEQVSAATGDSKEKVQKFAAAEAAAGHVYTNSTDLLAAYRGELDLTGDAGQTSSEKIGAFKTALKEQNDEINATIQPQLAMIDANKKMEDANWGVTRAERSLEDAHRGVAEAQDNVTRAEQRRQEASRRLTDAVRTQAEAQQALNDLLRGPSADEQINLESAQISLEEAQRRAAGITATDPGLERRRNALDVRRAEIALEQAQGAHAKDILAAQKTLADANQGVIDARLGVADAGKAVDDANRAVRDSSDKVADAERGVRDAHDQVFVAAMGVYTATTNLIGAYKDHDITAANTTEVLKRLKDSGSVTADEITRIGWAFVFAKAGADLWNNRSQGENPEKGQPLPESSGMIGPQGAGIHHDLGEPLPASSGMIGPSGAWQPHAVGGSLGEGWNLLGELGPELVHKSGGLVRVASNAVTQGILTPHPPGVAAAQASSMSSGYTHNGDIVIAGPQPTAEDVVYSLRKLALIRSSR